VGCFSESDLYKRDIGDLIEDEAEHALSIFLVTYP
jgi:hypothetical protein